MDHEVLIEAIKMKAAPVAPAAPVTSQRKQFWKEVSGREHERWNNGQIERGLVVKSVDTEWWWSATEHTCSLHVSIPNMYSMEAVHYLILFVPHFAITAVLLLV